MWVPHFETELELMLNHKEQGDEIFVLTCSGALPVCVSNYDHVKTACMKCRSRFDVGMGMIGVPKKNIFYIQKYSAPNNLPDTFSSLDELMRWTWNGIEFGRMIAASLITDLRDHRPNVNHYHHKIRLKFLAAFRAYYAMDITTNTIKPDAVYIYNGRFCEVAAAVAACKKNDTLFYTHERGGTANSYALFKNSIPHDIAYNKSTIKSLWQHEPDENKKREQAKQWFTDRRAGLEQSWLSFTADQKRGLLPEGFNPDKKNIAIFNSSIDEYSTFPAWQNPLFGDELDALEAILKYFKDDQTIHFYLRVHPHLKGFNNSQIKALKKIDVHGYKNLSVIWPEEVIDSYALLEACNKIVVFGSTIGAEACFWGKPAVLIGRALYEDLDCSYIPQTPEEAMQLIATELKPKEPSHALVYAFWEQNKGILFKRFKPDGLFKGAFLGKELKPQFGLRDKLLFRIYDRLNRWKSKNA